MSERADVVIIGAGIMGSAIAWYLSNASDEKIVVLEKGRIGRGSTAAAAGGVRLQFSTETNIRLSQKSFEVWENFEELFGVDLSLRQQGYMLLLTEDAQVPVFRENMKLQRSLGVPTEWLEPNDVRELNPAARIDDVIGATYCPRDGWCDPYTATMGFARAARKNGVMIRENTEVTGIEVEQGQVRSVQAGDSRIETDLVILCAGPYTNLVGKLAGLDLPIAPYRRMSFTTKPFGAVPSSIPFTVEFARGLYVHPEGPGFLFGMGDPNEPSSLNDSVDEAWMMTTIEALCDRFPPFETAAVQTGWAGFYEVTPDHNPLLGYLDEIGGMIVAAGFSGHGFMQGPAIGMCIAELVTSGQVSSVDISQFAPSRFREGKLTLEHNVI